jgi:hypothetical protein
MPTVSDPVKDALGVLFDQFRELAVQALDPAMRPQAERGMRELLETMTATQRLALRKALLGAKAYPWQRSKR